MAQKFTADSAGIVSVPRSVAPKCVTVDDAGVASRRVTPAHNDMRTVLGGIVSRTDGSSDSDHDGH